MGAFRPTTERSNWASQASERGRKALVRRKLLEHLCFLIGALVGRIVLGDGEEVLREHREGVQGDPFPGPWPGGWAHPSLWLQGGPHDLLRLRLVHWWPLMGDAHREHKCLRHGHVLHPFPSCR